MAAKKRKMFRLQDKSSESAKTRDASNDEVRSDEDINANLNLRDELRELVQANDEQYILGFSKDILGIIRFKESQEVLDYMLESAANENSVKYFIGELKDYLKLKSPPTNSPNTSEEPEQKSEQSQDSSEDIERDVPEFPDDLPEWEQDMNEGQDPIDFMKEHFQQAKERLENMLDRITICEVRLDGHDVDVSALQDEISNASTSKSTSTGDVSKEQLAEMKTEFFEALEKLKSDMNEAGTGGPQEYKITYPDKPTKSIKAILPPVWKKLMDLATTRSNIFLAGPTQCGKTKTTEMLAEALGLRYSALSCSEGMDEGIFQGRLLPIGENNKFEYVPSVFIDFYENGGVFLLDEFCASDSNLGVFMNNALGNTQFYLPIRYENPLVKRHKDFICIAADNTIGHGGDDMYVGRNQMDASTMERFRTGFLVMDYSSKVEKSVASEDVYDWAVMIRKAIGKLQMNRAMTTRTMIEFTKMEKERNWTLRDMEKVYFADWPKDDVKRLMKWIKQDLENTVKQAN